MNKKYIIIQVDTNDGDYIESNNVITDKQLELIKPLIQEIKNFQPYKGKEWSPGHIWNCTNNYPTQEVVRSSSGELSAEEYYLSKGIPKEIFNLFDEFVPFNEYGIHTIVSIDILETINEEKLL